MTCPICKQEFCIYHDHGKQRTAAQQKVSSDAGIGAFEQSSGMASPDSVPAATLTREQPSALSDERIEFLRKCAIAEGMGKTAECNLVFDQAKRANALAAAVERLKLNNLKSIASAEREIEQREALHGSCAQQLKDAIADLESAERQRDAAVAELKKYCDHGIFCGLINNEAVCTCGYDEAIKECGK